MGRNNLSFIPKRDAGVTQPYCVKCRAKKQMSLIKGGGKRIGRRNNH